MASPTDASASFTEAVLQAVRSQEHSRRPRIPLPVCPDGALPLVPEDAIGDGPFIYILLPRPFTDHVPVNARRLLREWEAQLRPVTYLVNAASVWLREEDVWDEAGQFVEPTETALHRVREAANEDRLVELFDQAKAALGTVLDSDGKPDESLEGTAIRDLLLVRADEDDHREFQASPQALPVLLGLAVAVAIGQPIGYHAARINAMLHESGSSG
jgi:hypothetical protein